MVINMAGRQQRDRRGVQAGVRASDPRAVLAEAVGHEACPCGMDGWSAGRVPWPPAQLCTTTRGGPSPAVA